jgi:hypothetical protein
MRTGRVDTHRAGVASEIRQCRALFGDLMAV